VVVMNDAYNANPASMAAGLKTLRSARPPGGRVIAVLGDMAELGDIAEAEHDRIGRLLVRLGVDRVIGIGPLSRITVEAARQEGIWDPADAVAVDDADTARKLLADDLRAGDVVLVKASRAAGLEQLAAALLADGPGRDQGGGGH
jgi:UDP-N-acetylmuramoyl-tripeptide--D-alanyl-D-alanine ligase